MVLGYFKSRFDKVKQALAKTRSHFTERLMGLLGRAINEETLDEIEQVLYEADLGVTTATELTDAIRKRHHSHPTWGAKEHLAALQEDLLSLFPLETPQLKKVENGPLVILIVGVNGNGKTTSIAKLAQRFVDEGNKVLLAAGDTFRAAAVEQLETWAKRLNIDLIKGKPGGDPAAVAYDALTAAKSRQCDVVLIDTAGRLHTKTPLMKELRKIRASCDKVLPNSPHETLLVLDATTGQNGIDQAKTFQEYTPLTGLILTKLDGTAKGGLAISITKQLQVPVKFIGVGEGARDLECFDSQSFVKALLEG